MKENSIEETIKQLKLILKIRKEQKEIIECAGGSCINCNPDIEALTNSIDILLDYKRVLKENEELKRNYKILKDDIEDERIVYIDTLEFEQRYIPVQKVKDKIEELKKQDKEWTEELSEPDSNFKIIDRNLKRIKNQIEILQELIESED